MHIDLTPLRNREKKMDEIAANYTIDDLRIATNESIDYMLDLVKGLTDADVVFTPQDEGASDPYAAEGEENIAWNLGHLIAHVTASSEEGAAFSSLLARGIPAEERPRYETPWQEMNSVERCVQRLEESRRMRLSYLDTWPDTPHLDVNRKISEGLAKWVGSLNAVGAFLFGLGHEYGHYEQLEEAIRQAVAAQSA